MMLYVYLKQGSESVYLTYNKFIINDSDDKYRLLVGGYNSVDGLNDPLAYHNNK